MAPQTKEILGIIAPAISFVGDGLYIRSILAGRTKPHVFSWLVWGLISAVVFSGQISAHAGPGAWVTGYSVAASWSFAALGLRAGRPKITRGDWLALIASLAALPVWILTANPLWSVTLVTAIDLTIFYPTVRKSYNAPFSETIPSYLLFVLTFAVDLLAIEDYSFTTVVYPAYVVASYSAFVLMLAWRRARLARHDAPLFD